MNATFPRILLALAMVLTMWTPSARSQADAPDAAKHACTEIRDDTQRLACYDRAFGKPGAAANKMRPASSPQAPADQFGFTPSQIERASPNAEKTPPPAERIEAEVTALDYRPGRKFVATLANGQVWMQTEIDTKVQVAVGDVVTIRKGALSSYLLSSPGGLATRVKRVR